MQSENDKNNLNLEKKLLIALATIYCIFQLYTAGVRELPAMQQRTSHLVLALLMIFIIKPASKKYPILNKFNIVFVVATLLSGGYLIINYEAIVYRLGLTTTMDLVAGAVLIVLIIEATRRCMGMPLPTIALAALAYNFFGQHLPRSVAHGGFDLTRIVSHLSLTTEGIFGIPLGASATVVAIFILFASVLNGIGAGQFFVNLSMSKFGKSSGGSAKAAVVGSGLMGMLTGSVIAAVMGIGTFTTPLMKENGYDPKTSASITAVAATGGQIMPPVMGAAAYIIAEVLRLQVIDVVKAAVIPAFLYYFAVYCWVDIESRKNNRIGLEDEKIKQYKDKTKGRYYLMAPILALVVLMVIMNTLPGRSAFYAIVFALAIGLIQKENRLNLNVLIEIFVSTAKGCLEVACATACAGIIIGVLSLTGLGLQLSTLIIGLASGNLILLLLLTMIVSIILGMGMTTTACYIILSVLVAPSLVDMGVLPIAAHFFVFFFGMYSFITPPVALGSYAAASLTGADPFSTGFKAFVIAIPSFLIPFFFIYEPALLWIGSAFDVISVFVTSTIGIYFIATGTVQYFKRNLAKWESIIFFIAGTLLVVPGLITDLLGFIMGFGLLVKIYLIEKKYSEERAL